MLLETWFIVPTNPRRGSDLSIWNRLEIDSFPKKVLGLGKFLDDR